MSNFKSSNYELKSYLKIKNIKFTKFVSHWKKSNWK